MAETAAQKKAREANKDKDATSGAQEFVDSKDDDGKTILTGVAITSNVIRNWFKSHDLDPEQRQSVDRVNEAGAAFAQIIADNCPNGEDRRTAILKIREAAFLTNSAIANRGR